MGLDAVDGGESVTGVAGFLGPRSIWYLARASGLTAWCLMVASVALGLVMASKPKWKGLPPAWRLDLHRFLGGLTVCFTALHVGTLLLDKSVPFGAIDVLVPFASRWRPAAVAGGVFGLYLLLAVEGTSLLMRRLPRRWWHRVHLSSLLLLVAATVHGLMAGTDSGNLILTDVLVGCGVLLAPLGVFRVWRAGRRPSSGAAGRGRPTEPGPRVATPARAQADGARP